MYSTIVIALSTVALVTAQATGKLGNAAVVSGNPAGVTYTATLPNSATSNIRGYVAATTNANGTGVSFNVNLSGFPSATLGPFLYHIHDQPVPSSGNCTGTLAHLDPYIRGEMPPCDMTHPETCQVGDLAGKHGKITTPSFQASYVDLYASTISGIGAFVGNRSIVIHTANATRLTCASFVLTSSSTSNSSNTPSSSPSPSPSSFKGGAATNFAGATAAVGVVVAALAFLL